LRTASRDLLARLILDDLANAETERIMAGGKVAEVRRIRIRRRVDGSF
jgi:hypothetical protein